MSSKSVTIEKYFSFVHGTADLYTSYVTYIFILRCFVSSRFSGNSEAFASEFLRNIPSLLVLASRYEINHLIYIVTITTRLPSVKVINIRHDKDIGACAHYIYEKH